MGKYALKSNVRGQEFGLKYILSEEIIWRECEDDKNPFKDITILAGIYHICTSFFTQASLKIPFDHLLVDFVYKTRLHIGQLSPNTIRIVLGVAELNWRYGLNLDFRDIRYCYDLASKNDKKQNLKDRVQSPSLVKALPYSHILIIKGKVECDPVNKPIPKQFDAPGLYF